MTRILRISFWIILCWWQSSLRLLYWEVKVDIVLKHSENEFLRWFNNNSNSSSTKNNIRVYLLDPCSFKINICFCRHLPSFAAVCRHLPLFTVPECCTFAVANKMHNRKECLPWVKEMASTGERDNPCQGISPISMTQKDYPDSAQSLSPRPSPGSNRLTVIGYRLMVIGYRLISNF